METDILILSCIAIVVAVLWHASAVAVTNKRVRCVVCGKWYREDGE